MGFLQNCLIHKNTPELHEKLKALGIRHNTLDDNTYKSIVSNYGLFISVHEDFCKHDEYTIDCGDNEQLFLALAALRNDTDKNQWERSNSNLPGHYMQLHGHKASVDEIINHFKN